MPKMVKLEERIVLDAAAAIVAAEELMQDTGEHLVEMGSEIVSELAAAPNVRESETLDIVLVSSTLDDVATLQNAIAGDALVYVYDAEQASARDVLTQVAQMAASQGAQVGSLTVLSHGEAGTFNLGQDQVDLQAIEQDRYGFAALKDSFAADATIQLLACNVGADGQGQAIVDALALQTGATVQASDDLSGKDGDWELELSSSKQANAAAVEALDVALLESYQHNLALTVETNETLTVDEGVNAVISSAHLESESDTGLTPAEIQYTITTFPTRGQIVVGDTVMVDDPDSPATFTQEDINEGRVVYQHNGDEEPLVDSFEFIVTDDELGSASGSFNIEITPSNDAPRLDLDTTLPGRGSAPAEFTENGDPVLATSLDVGISDADDTLIESAEVFIDGRPNGTAEILAVDTTGTNITATYDLSTGILTLVGSDTAENYEMVLETLTYQNTSDDPQGELRNLRITVSDGDEDSRVSTAKIRIVPINDAAEVDLNGDQAGTDGGEVTFTEDQGPVLALQFPDDVVIGDLDGTTLDSVTVSITNLLDAPHEALNADVTGTSITFNYDPTTGVLTLSGTDSIENYEQVLGTLTYVNTFDGLDLTDRVISITAFDGVDQSDSVESIVHIVPENDAPEWTAPANITVDEDAATTLVGISLADVDAGNGDLTASLSVSNGSLALVDTTGLTIISNTGSSITVQGTLAELNNALATLQYTGDANYVGDDTLVLNVNDQGNTGLGNVLTDDATVAITVAPVNDAPVWSTPSATPQATEDVTTGIAGLSISDIDAGDGDLKITISADNGSLNLAATDGLMVISNNNGTVEVQGSLEDINAALATLQYTGDQHFNGVDQLTLLVDDLGNTGSGGALTHDATLNVNVAPVNDAPTWNVPGEQTIAEDTTATIPGLSISDVDDNGGDMSVELSVGNGTLNLVTTTGLTVTDNGTGTVQVVGSKDDINAALATLEYTGNANYVGDDTLVLRVEDGGNTGAGGNLVATETVELNITDVNDAPTWSVPDDQTTAEDTAVTLTGLSVSDIDAADSDIQITVSTENGELNFGDTTGLVTIADTGDTVTLRGSQDDINAALTTLEFDPEDNFTGDAEIDLFVDDLGNTGGGSLTAEETLIVDVTPVNDAPTVTVPGEQTVAEEGTIAIPGVSIADIDAGDAPVTVQVSAGQGTVQLGDTTDVFFIRTADGFSITGSIDDINNALTTLEYVGDLDFTGTDTLTVVVDDLGNTGAGGPLTAEQNVTINVTPVNDAPEITGPATATVTEDAATPVAGVSISDVDGSDQIVEVTISAEDGEPALGDLTGLTVVADDDNTLVVQGTVDDINAALGTLTYEGDEHFNGDDALTIVVNDLGNTGEGDPETDTLVIGLTVEPVNDAPEVTVPADVTVDEEETITITGINISDIDAGDESVTVTITVGDGTVAVGTPGPVTVAGDDTNTLTLEGSIDEINAALATLEYTGNTDFVGTDTVTVAVDDQGNTGDGGALSAEESFQINVEPVNDAPVVSGPATATVTEDAATPISGVSIADVDGGDQIVEVTISAENGEPALGDLTGLTVVADDDNSIVVRGTIEDINDALDTLTYEGEDDAVADDTLTIVVNDLGNTGDGGEQTDTLVIALSTTPVNDAPEVTVPADAIVDEDVATTIAGISISDIDAGDESVLVTLSVTDGTLTIGTPGAVTVSDAGTDTVTLEGSVDEINAALATLEYTGDADFVGTDTLTVTVDDQGNTGAGGALTAEDSFNITVEPVNDAPEVSGPASAAVTEDTASPVAGISISDVDGGDQIVEVTISAEDGNPELGDLAGLTVVSNDDNSIVVRGSIDDINAALDTLTYEGDENFDGDDALTITVNDLGNTGDGGEQIDTLVVAINVDPVNDAPEWNVPDELAVDEEATTTLDGISIADVDAGDGTIVVTLSVEDGVLDIGVPGGVAVTGDGTTLVTLEGTLDDINAALTTLQYTGDDDFSGEDTLTLFVDDQGTGGAGGDLTDATTVVIRVEDLADAPVIDPDGPGNPADSFEETFIEDNGPVGILTTALELDDIDSDTLDGATVQLVNRPDGIEEVLSVDTTGTNITVVYDPATGVLTLTGNDTIENYEQVLESLAYDNGAEEPDDADRNISITVTDPDGRTSNPVYGVVHVQLTNDEPQVTAPQDVAVTEDGSVAIAGVSVSDADAGAGDLTVTISVDNGQFTIGDTDGLNFSAGDGTGDTTVTFSGSVEDVNAALDSIEYTPDNNFDGTDTMTIEVSDQGNSGAGGALTDTASININVQAVGDAPSVDVDGPGADDSFGGTFTEDAGPVSVMTDAITISDIDSTVISGAVVQLTNPVNGIDELLAVTTDGTNITASYDPATNTLTLSGDDTFANYEQVLATLTYDNQSDNPTAATRDLTLVVIDDSGNESNVAPGEVTVVAVNDEPSISSNTGVTVSTGGSVNINTGLSLDDPDNAPADTIITITLAPTEGTILINGVPAGLGDTFTQEQLDQGLVVYSSTGDEDGTDAFEFTVTDTDGASIGPERFDIEIIDAFLPPGDVAGDFLSDTGDDTQESDPGTAGLGASLGGAGAQGGGANGFGDAAAQLDAMADGAQHFMDLDPSNSSFAGSWLRWDSDRGEFIRMSHSSGGDAVNDVCSILDTLDIGCRVAEDGDANDRIGVVDAGNVGLTLDGVDIYDSALKVGTIGNSQVVEEGDGCETFNSDSGELAEVYETQDPSQGESCAVDDVAAVAPVMAPTMAPEALNLDIGDTQDGESAPLTNLSDFEGFEASLDTDATSVATRSAVTANAAEVVQVTYGEPYEVMPDADFIGGPEGMLPVAEFPITETVMTETQFRALSESTDYVRLSDEPVSTAVDAGETDSLLQVGSQADFGRADAVSIDAEPAAVSFTLDATPDVTEPAIDAPTSEVFDVETIDDGAAVDDGLGIGPGLDKVFASDQQDVAGPSDVLSYSDMLMLSGDADNAAAVSTLGPGLGDDFNSAVGQEPMRSADASVLSATELAELAKLSR